MRPYREIISEALDQALGELVEMGNSSGAKKGWETRKHGGGDEPGKSDINRLQKELSELIAKRKEEAEGDREDLDDEIAQVRAEIKNEKRNPGRMAKFRAAFEQSLAEGTSEGAKKGWMSRARGAVKRWKIRRRAARYAKGGAGEVPDIFGISAWIEKRQQTQLRGART